MTSKPAQPSMIAIDLTTEKEALELAKKLAEKTGKTVVVRRTDGEVLGTVQAAP